MSVIAAGCMVGPTYVQPSVEEPSHFKSQAVSEGGPPTPREWWQLYGDSELDRLIATANASNQTLRQAVARVDEARALARVAGSFLYPTISLDPNFTHLRTSANRASTITGQRVGKGVNVNDWLIPFDLTYEIDVWGRVRRSFESARAQAAASADDMAVGAPPVPTDVATFFYALRALYPHDPILTPPVNSYREQVRILSVQLKTRLVSPIVFNQ